MPGAWYWGGDGRRYDIVGDADNGQGQWLQEVLGRSPSADELRDQRRENYKWRMWAIRRWDPISPAGAAPLGGFSSGHQLEWMWPGKEADSLWMRETRWEARCLRAARRLAAERREGWGEANMNSFQGAPRFQERWRADMVWRRWQQEQRGRSKTAELDRDWHWLPRTPSPQLQPVNVGLWRLGGEPPPLELPVAAAAATPAYVPEQHVLVAVPVSRLGDVAGLLGSGHTVLPPTA